MPVVRSGLHRPALRKPQFVFRETPGCPGELIYTRVWLCPARCAAPRVRKALLARKCRVFSQRALGDVDLGFALGWLINLHTRAGSPANLRPARWASLQIINGGMTEWWLNCLTKSALNLVWLMTHGETCLVKPKPDIDVNLSAGFSRSALHPPRVRATLLAPLTKHSGRCRSGICLGLINKFTLGRVPPQI